ncbi:transposase [Mesorhizobium sp. J18]|jgi:putative transposase|nr:transposase-like protein [Ochrobactrum sp. RH1CCR137]MBA8855699.1 transposase-like protein [Ochrobactrum sp. RH1CCR134]TWG91760.1 transposase [Mesorhizobium sp. J18]
MATKRHKPDEIVTKLRQVEVLRGQGMAMADAVRQIGVSELTYYRWRKQYGGMSRDQLGRRRLQPIDSRAGESRRHDQIESRPVIDLDQHTTDLAERRHGGAPGFKLARMQIDPTSFDQNVTCMLAVQT